MVTTGILTQSVPDLNNRDTSSQPNEPIINQIKNLLILIPTELKEKNTLPITSSQNIFRSY